ncbi:MAG: xylose isomerase [Pirellulaceae bacterium]|nr:MAG: xylose isomerase [Pirellulaceae bacterium]
MAAFRYCLNGSTIRPTPLLEKIRVSAQAGYDAVELWFDDIEDYVRNGGSLRDIRHALDDAGIELATLIYLRDWFDATGEQFERAWAEARRRIEWAAQLQAPFVIASPPAGPADYAEGARRYAALIELGRPLGVRPIMEFLGFVQDLNSIDKVLLVLEQCGSPDAVTVVDPFHIARGGDCVESLRNLRASQIAISHFNDIPASPPADKLDDADRVYPGDGVFDLRQYVRLLYEIGYRGFLSLELFRRELWEQPPGDVARTGLAKMQTVVESAGLADA